MAVSSTNIANASDHKLYKRRWFMLLLFMLYSFNGTLQWTQFTVINNLTTKYYNVTTTQVEWTANVFVLSFIVLAVPSLYLIDLMGVRYVMILSALGIAVGNWMKLFSVASDRFYLTFLGQCCAASFLKLTYGLFGRFTAIWFGADEISTAGVLVVVGDHLGSAFSYIFPTFLVLDGSHEVIGDGMRNMHLCVSISSTAIFLLILFFFQTKPKIPPSVAQVKQKQVKHEKILPTLSKMMRKRGVLLFIVSYGLNCATSTAVAICLHEIIVTNFSTANSNDVGNIGFVMMLIGIFGSLLVGKMLDKTRLFKEFAVILTIGATVAMILFTLSLKSGHILFVYGAVLLIGFFVTGYYSSGMQLGIELTYPIHEEISTTVTFLSGALFTLIVTVVYGYMIKIYGDLISNIGMVLLNIVAVIATISIPVELKRQRAEYEPKSTEMKEFI